MEIIGGCNNGVNEAKERGKEKHQAGGICRKRKRTIAHLPKSVRSALSKQASSVAKKTRKSRGKG
jgi:hypothetical protein